MPFDDSHKGKFLEQKFGSDSIDIELQLPSIPRVGESLWIRNEDGTGVICRVTHIDWMIVNHGSQNGNTNYTLDEVQVDAVSVEVLY